MLKDYSMTDIVALINGFVDSFWRSVPEAKMYLTFRGLISKDEYYDGGSREEIDLKRWRIFRNFLNQLRTSMFRSFASEI